MNSLFTRFAVIIAFLTVGFGANAQSISSTLNNRPNVHTNVEESFTVTLAPGALSPFTQVKLQIALGTPAQSANINLSLLNPQSGQYEALVFDGSGISLSAAAPFFLVSPLSAKVTFTAPGVYNYSLSILDGSTNAVIANSNESVTVTDPPVPPTISSDLDGQTVNTGDVTDFDVTTTTGDFANTLVRVHIQLANAAQTPDVNLSYEATPGNFLPLPLTAGAADFGPAGGFPLSNLSSAFRAAFDAPGVYGYKLSLYEVSSGDTLAASAESVTVEDVVPATISSDLDGQTVHTSDVTDFEVTTTTGDFANTLVRVHIQLANAAQTPDVNLSYEATPGNFLPLPLTAGAADFGPVGGFPLSNLSSAFRAAFDAPGVYGYKLSLYEVASGDTLASSTESVTVADLIAATISSDLDGQTVTVGDVTDFDVTTTTGDFADTLVRVHIQLANVAQTADVNLSYEATPGNFLPLTLTAGAADFGPVGGFPLNDLSSAFRATFDAAGVYNYTLSLYQVNGGDTLAVSEESVTVEDVVVPQEPEISTDLDNRSGVTVNNEETFDATTVANGATGNVRIKITLANPAQADSVDIQFQNPANSNFEQLTFDASGVAFAGATAGFAVADADYAFKVTFLGGGTYAYNVALVQAGSNTVLADSDEEVYVLDNSGIANNVSTIVNAFPNPTTDQIQIQTQGTGAGTLDVFTLTGQKVVNQNINGNVHTVSLAQLPTGVYVVKISQNGNTSVIRVVKK